MGLGTDGPNWSYTGLVCGAVSLATKQWTLVELDANGDVITVSGAGVMAIGVLYNKPAVGEEAEVRFGHCVVQAGAALNEGARISPAADGEAVAITGSQVSNGTATGVVGTIGCGFMIEAAGGAGEQAGAFIMPGYTEITAVAT